MNDLDRWVSLEGPPPEGVRELLDAACGIPPMTPELEERLDRRLYAALATDRRRWARRRTLKRALGGGLLTACLAAGMVLLLRSAAPPASTIARDPSSSEAEPVPTQLMGTEIPAPPLPVPPLPAVSATSRLPDKGVVHAPKKSSGSGLPRPQ
jgi:hypothetical protein